MSAAMPKAEMVSLGELIDRDECFLIPLYQRLYVWKSEQVERLMDDIIAAWQQSKPVYYLGGILAIRRRNEKFGTGELELIDGQQRLTTLWLMAIAWRDKSGGDALADFVRVGDAPRLRFAIREEVNHFIRTTLTGKPERSADTAAMENALAVLRARPDNRDESGGQMPTLVELARFIRNSVKLAVTEVPANTDLNKLFEVINNRGEQLQHHDILKQRLLRQIADDTEREAYACLWDACAAMDGYVERNLLKVRGKSVRSNFQDLYRFSSPGSLGATEKLIAAIQGETDYGDGGLLSLEEVLSAENTVERQATDSAQDEEDKNDREEDGAAIQSILSFPLLLQHVLRIFCQREGKPDLGHIHDKDLLALFGEYFFSVAECQEHEAATKAFIRLLWEVRVAFDAYVVKWVERDQGERQLDVRRIDEANSFSRTVEGVPRELSLLQAMIYHSRGKTSQYWLTPFLRFALDNPGWDDVLLYLEYLDHCLFSCGSEKNQRELSYELLQNKIPQPIFCDLPGALQDRHGTDFRHYWFYKTEYVLWKAPQKHFSVPGGWRIVARNSVEHIAPQNAIGGQNEVGDWLHAFANLALVSREENSRYGNDIFEQKKQKYKRSEKATRSLKQELVFMREDWTADTIKEHQQELVAFWRSYLERLSADVAQRWSDQEKTGEGHVNGW